MHDDDLNLADELDDYETGFVDALLYQQGITKPTREQVAAAMHTFDRFLAQRAQDEAAAS